MKKITLLLALVLFLGTTTFAEKIEVKTKTEIVKKDSVKADTPKVSKAEKIITNTKVILDKITEQPMPEQGSNGLTWLYWILGFLAPILLGWLRNLTPSKKSNSKINVLEQIIGILVWILNIVPNRKSGGGIHRLKTLAKQNKDGSVEALKIAKTDTPA